MCRNSDSVKEKENVKNVDKRRRAQKNAFSVFLTVIREKSMKIFHLSDLHIGKALSGYEMWDDQGYVFEQIISYIKSEKPDAVLIAGDIYDKVMPSAKAVTFFNDFLTKMSDTGTSVMIIAGNHDSGERLDFASGILQRENIYIKGTYGGKALKVTKQDEYGDVNFYLMPFVRPIDISSEEISNYTDAMEEAIRRMNVDKESRNVIVAHQNVTKGGVNKKSESETITIGMLDNIESEVFSDFDYVALGHLHSPQSIGNEKIRYSGTPVIYSISEKDDEKAVTVIDMKEKGDVSISALPLKQLHKWYEFTGTLEEALKRECNEDYARIILTDEETIIDAYPRLKSVYKKLLSMEFKEREGSSDSSERTLEYIENLSPEEAVADFYKQKKGTDLSPENEDYIKSIIEEYINQTY